MLDANIRFITSFLLNSRMYDVCCSTYESASLRMFIYGRTDAIRSTTAESSKFVHAMQDPAKQVLLEQPSVTVQFLACNLCD